MFEPPPAPVVLNIPTSPGCNNACEFCIDEGGGQARFSLAEIVAQLEEGRRLSDAVLFTNGEPTLFRALPEAMDAARGLGFCRIGLVTNGRRLSDVRLARRLLDCGLNDVTVSIHGPSPAVHDDISGRPGSFEEARRGLVNLAALRRDRSFGFRMNCTLVRKNLHCMREMYAFAMSHGLDALNFNAVEPRGRAARRFDEVVPRYRDVVAAADTSGLDFGRPDVSLSRVRACAGGGEWVQEDMWISDGRALARMDPDAGRVRGAICAACAIADHCPGIWAEIASRHGWEDLVPLTHPSLRRGERWWVEIGSGGARGADGSAFPSTALHDGWQRGFRRVVFAGEEPIASPELPALVALARRMGFEEVAVETTARPLADRPFSSSFAALHLDRAVVRLHGASPRTYDPSAGAPGSFRRAVEGVSALRRLGVPYEVRFTGSEAELPEARRLADRLGAPLVRRDAPPERLP